MAEESEARIASGGVAAVRSLAGDLRIALDRATVAEEARERTIKDVDAMAEYMADVKLEVGEKAVKVAAYLLGMKIRLAGASGAAGKGGADV